MQPIKKTEQLLNLFILYTHYMFACVEFGLVMLRRLRQIPGSDYVHWPVWRPKTNSRIGRHWCVLNTEIWYCLVNIQSHTTGTKNSYNDAPVLIILRQIVYEHYGLSCLYNKMYLAIAY